MALSKEWGAWGSTGWPVAAIQTHAGFPQVNETEGLNHNLSSEMSKLQSENAKLKVLTNQKEKEILHLRDPDKDMVHKIRILSDEVTMLRTQTRRLNEEKVSFLLWHYLIVHLVSMVQGREQKSYFPWQK